MVTLESKDWPEAKMFVEMLVQLLRTNDRVLVERDGNPLYLVFDAKFIQPKGSK